MTTRARARAFFLMTGDPRAAIRGSAYPDQLDKAVVRHMLRGRLETSPAVEPGWPANSAEDGWLWSAFVELPAEARALIALSLVGGVPDEELGAALGCAPATIALSRDRAHRDLAERLARADVDASGIPIDTDRERIRTGLESMAERALLAAELETAMPPLRPVRRKYWTGLAITLVALAGLAFALKNQPKPELSVEIAPGSEVEIRNGALIRIGRGSITDARWSPDGARIWISTSTGEYSLAASTLRPLAFSAAPQAAKIRLLGFSADSGEVAAWEDGALIIRNALTLHPVFTGAAETGSGALAIAYDHLNDVLALGDDTGVRITHPRNGGLETRWPGLPGLRTLKFSPNGAWLAMAGQPAKSFLLDPRTGQSVSVGESPFAPQALAFSGNSGRLVSIRGDGIEVVEVGRAAPQMRIGLSSLLPLAWVNGDGSRAVAIDTRAATAEAEVVTLDTDSGAILRRLQLPGDPAIGLAVIAPDGRRAFIVNADGLFVWNLDDARLIATSADFAPPRPLARPLPLTFSPDGGQIVVPMPYGGLRVVDAGSGNTIRVFDDQSGPYVLAAISPGSLRLAVDNNAGVSREPIRPGEQVGASSPGIVVFDMSSGRTTHLIPGARQPQFISSTLLMYRSAWANEIRQFDFLSGANQAIAGPGSAGADAGAAARGMARVAVLTDRALEVWDAGAVGRRWGAPLARNQMDRTLLGTPLAISGDGGLVAVAEPGLGIQLFDGASGVQRATLARPITVSYDASNENPLKVAISPNGRWVATIDNRSAGANEPAPSLSIWRVDGQSVNFQSAGFPMRLAGYCFSPDGRRLAVISADYVVRFIDLP